AWDAADEMHRSVGEGEVGAIRVVAGEVVESAVGVGLGIIEVAVSQDQRRGRERSRAVAGVRVARPAPNDAVIDRAGPDAFDVGPGRVADQDRLAGSIRDVGQTGPAVAIEGAEAGGAEGVRFIAADTGGVAARRGLRERGAEYVRDRERAGRNLVGRANVQA